MFSKRKSFPQGYKFNREFLDSLVKDLESAGFDSVTVKLPRNLIKDDNYEIEVEEFINRGRNYPSVIFIAQNTKAKETVKILFVNISTKAFFNDNTFPSGHSEPPELYVQTTDPGRTFSLFGYFYDYLKVNHKTKNRLLFLFGVAAFVFYILEFVSISHRKLLFQEQFGVSPWVDVLFVLVFFILQFKFFTDEGGLYVKEKESIIFNNLRRILHGEFRDNPIINLLVTIIGGFIVILLSHFLF